MAGPERSEPFGVSEKGGRYAALGHSGKAERWFDSRPDAEAFANQRREQHERLKAEAHAMQGGDPPAPASGGRYRVEQRGDGLYDVISASGNVTIGGLDTPEEARQRLDEQQARDDRRRAPPPPMPAPSPGGAAASHVAATRPAIAPPPPPGAPPPLAPLRPFAPRVRFAGMGPAFRNRAAMAAVGMGPAAAAFAGMPGLAAGIPGAAPSAVAPPPLPPGWGGAASQQRAAGPIPAPPALQPAGPASVPAGLGKVAVGMAALVAAMRHTAQAGPFGSALAPGPRAAGFARVIGQGIAGAFKAAPNLGPTGIPAGFIRPMTSAQHQASRTRAGRRFARAARAAATARFVSHAGAYRAARRAGVSPVTARRFAGFAGTRGGMGAGAAFGAYRGGAGAAGIARAFAGGVGGGAGAALGAAAGLAAGFAAAIPAFAEMVREMKAFANSTVEANRGLARWNGAIATGYMSLAMGDFRRNVAMGRATQGSALSLARGVDTMRDAWQPVDIAGAGIRNRAAGAAAAFAGEVGRGLAPGANAITGLMDRADPNGWVSAGTAAGVGAGLTGMAGSAYDQFLNHPAMTALNPVGAFWTALTAGQKAAAGAADAKVAQLASGATAPNDWGLWLHRSARGGPMLRRPAPRP